MTKSDDHVICVTVILISKSNSLDFFMKIPLMNAFDWLMEE